MRAAVSVVVPFAEGREQAEWLAEGLGRLRLGPGDELIIADNRHGGSTRELDLAPLAALGRVVAAPELRSSYYARNVGAGAASGEWLLFIDSDCRPDADLLDRIVPASPRPELGVVAGEVEALAGQRGLPAVHARERGHLGVAAQLQKGPFPSGVGANLLVRRRTWESLGGFCEVRSGADLELCWRAQQLGWELDYAPDALVAHRHSERLGAMLAKARRYGPGQLWLRRRFPGSIPRPDTPRQLARAIGGGLAWTVTGQWRRAAFKLIDGLWESSYGWGWLAGSNRAQPGVAAGRSATEGDRASGLAYLLDAYPAASETFVYRELERIESRLGPAVIESMSRPERPAPEAPTAARLTYLEDDSPREKLAALAWLARRNPRGLIGDLRMRRRFEAGALAWPTAAIAPAARRLEAEGVRHIHVHFAAGAALNAMRIARLTGITYSVQAHAYEVFRAPTDIRAKLEDASFVCAPSRYVATELERLAPGIEARVLGMGVDAEAFQRQAPLPEERRVLAVGRLVEKKGFEHLIRAARLLADKGTVERVLIIGEGELRGRLEALIAELDLGAIVSIEPAWGVEAVRSQMEQTRVFAAPSVVAADGDREGSPVVIREAMAMALPVVASATAGIPELVDESRGRLVAPGDAEALAQALGELLDAPSNELETLGSAGRSWVREHASIEASTARLAELLGPQIISRR